jgi:hypothetical protein
MQAERYLKHEDILGQTMQTTIVATSAQLMLDVTIESGSEQALGLTRETYSDQPSTFRLEACFKAGFCLLPPLL